jgi:CRISPR-associated protein Csm4
MPQLKIYHLTFPRGLHIGRGGVESVEDSLEYVPSDTLFAALLDTWRHMGKDLDSLVSNKGKPALLLTSAFPFAGKVRFYPKPIDLRAFLSPERIKNLGAGKTIKKIRYLSERLIERARCGEFLDDKMKKDQDGDWSCKISLQGGALWLTAEEVTHLPDEIRYYNEESNGRKKRERPPEILEQLKIYASQTVPRVVVDRINSAPNLFQSERVIFSQGCGLWFGVVQNSISQPDFDNLLITLGDSGLGGERTAGYGHFKFSLQGALDLPDPQELAYLINRWHPKDGAEVSLLLKEGSAYKLEAVEGWLRTPDSAAAQRRKRLWMVAEGSLIDGSPLGDAANVKPEYDASSGETIPHPIYRPGFAVALDWKRR